jgi:thioredoxin 1
MEDRKMVQKITENEFNELDKSGVIVVDFSAVWCGPCQMLAPVLEELSEEFEGKIRFYNVDTDQNINLAQQYKIMSIPALLVLKNGEKQDMLIGFQPKESLKNSLEGYVQG